jgi:hypothetical protein
MASITGFGGALVRANDPEALYRWYERHLGLNDVRRVFRVSRLGATRSGRLRLFGQGDECFLRHTPRFFPLPGATAQKARWAEWRAQPSKQEVEHLVAATNVPDVLL